MIIIRKQMKQRDKRRLIYLVFYPLRDWIIQSEHECRPHAIKLQIKLKIALFFKLEKLMWMQE